MRKEYFQCKICGEYIKRQASFFSNTHTEACRYNDSHTSAEYVVSFEKHSISESFYIDMHNGKLWELIIDYNPLNDDAASTITNGEKIRANFLLNIENYDDLIILDDFIKLKEIHNPRLSRIFNNIGSYSYLKIDPDFYIRFDTVEQLISKYPTYRMLS